MSGRSYDLLVVGGGIIGCGIARDAAVRGLRVALAERDDLGSGTTSRSTRLIHGGLRYLELFDFGLVREDLRERETLIGIAPHLVRPLPFVVPMYQFSVYQRVRLKLGMVLYDLLSYDKSLPNHRFLSRAEILAAEPNLDPDGLQGAARYLDAQVEFPERLCLENALDAADHGAIIRNYTRVDRFLVEEGRVVGAELRDTRNGERAAIRARLSLNVTGPWLDRTLADIRPSAPPLLRTTRGVHLVTRKLASNGVGLFSSDGRFLLIVPWRGLSLIGTTDTDEPEPPESSRAEVDDIRYLIEETRRAFPGLASLNPYYTMAGVRALVRREGVRESEVSRKHVLHDHEAKGEASGLFSVAGGKITGYRAIAEDAVDLAGRKLGHRAACTTAGRALPGAPPDLRRLETELGRGTEGLRLAEDQRQYLMAQYGRRSTAVLDLASDCSELAQRVCPGQPTIMAEVVHAAREEAAVSLIDVLLRRTPLGLAPGHALEAAPRVAAILGRELDWDASTQAAEVEQYRRHLARLYTPDGEAPPP